MTRCRSCGAQIRWAVTAGTGKRIPLDVDPCHDGNLVIASYDPGPNGPVPVVVHQTPNLFAEGEDRPRFVSHFATCPNARDHRRPT